MQRHEQTTLPVGLHEEARRLTVLAELAPGWDSYDADRISPDALEGARRIIAKVALQSGARPYAISPLSGGGVQVEWHGAFSEVEVEVSPNQTLHYLIVQDPNGESKYVEKNDVSLGEVLHVVSDVVR